MNLRSNIINKEDWIGIIEIADRLGMSTKTAAKFLLKYSDRLTIFQLPGSTRKYYRREEIEIVRSRMITPAKRPLVEIVELDFSAPEPDDKGISSLSPNEKRMAEAARKLVAKNTR